MAATAAECLQDEFDRRCVPDELLQAFQEQGTAFMSRRAANSRMGAIVRAQVLALVKCFLNVAAWRVDVWFEVVRLLDGSSMSVAESKDAASPEVLTARAAALCLAAFALAGEGKTADRWPLQSLALFASSISGSFRSGAVPAKAIVREQHSLLLEVDAAPSPHRWLLAFVARFDAALRHNFSHALEHLERISIRLAMLLLRRAPAHEKRPPRSIAAGAFATALIYKGVLPASYLLPGGADEWRWGVALQSLSRQLPWIPYEASEAQNLLELRKMKHGLVLAVLSLAMQSDCCTIRAHVQELWRCS